MRRALLAAIAVALLPAGLAHGQVGGGDDAALWGARLRITPYLGLAPAFKRSETRTTFSGEGVERSTLRVSVPSGLAMGTSVEVRAHGRFGVIASGTFVPRGRPTAFDPVDGVDLSFPSSDYLHVYAAAAIRLREPISEMQLRELTATVFAGPAFTREIPNGDPLVPPGDRKAMNLLGGVFGVDAELPFSDQRFALQLGIEDNVTWWNETELARRVDRANAHDGIDTATVLDAKVSHVWVLRLGLSLQVQ